MPKQNQFSGASLADAVRQATAAYRRDGVIEAKSFCSNLRNQFEKQKSELDQIHRDIADIEDEIDNLKRAAARASLTALVLSFSAAASALRRWRGIINLLKRFKLDEDTLNAIL